MLEPRLLSPIDADYKEDDDDDTLMIMSEQATRGATNLQSTSDIGGRQPLQLDHYLQDEAAIARLDAAPRLIHQRSTGLLRLPTCPREWFYRQFTNIRHVQRGTADSSAVWLADCKHCGETKTGANKLSNYSSFRDHIRGPHRQLFARPNAVGWGCWGSDGRAVTPPLRIRSAAGVNESTRRQVKIRRYEPDSPAARIVVNHRTRAFFRQPSPTQPPPPPPIVVAPKRSNPITSPHRQELYSSSSVLLVTCRIGEQQSRLVLPAAVSIDDRGDFALEQLRASLDDDSGCEAADPLASLYIVSLSGVTLLNQLAKFGYRVLSMCKDAGEFSWTLTSDSNGSGAICNE